MRIHPAPPFEAFRRACIAAVWLLGGAAAGAQAGDAAGDPRGRWITASGNLEVAVAPCGPRLCGTVTRVLGNRSMTPGGGEMQAADARSPLGMAILKDFEPLDADAKQPATQWRGEIYNRENGKTYRCTMRVSTERVAAGELVLHAYVGLPLFGRTQQWQRAPAQAEGGTDAPAVPVGTPQSASAAGR